MNISTTSPEILNTILFLAQGDNTEAMRIWRAPTPKEELFIYKMMTKLAPANEFYWGDAGNNWANYILDV